MNQQDFDKIVLYFQHVLLNQTWLQSAKPCITNKPGVSIYMCKESNMMLTVTPGYVVTATCGAITTSFNGLPSYVSSQSITWRKNAMLHRETGPAYMHLYEIKYYLEDYYVKPDAFGIRYEMTFLEPWSETEYLEQLLKKANECPGTL